jgi:hypothetical protein
VADEKHTWWLGERVYVATTAAAGCLLGVGLAETADAVALTQAYGEFQQEVHALNPDYAPQSVNTDGWEGTQSAWKSLFPGITLMLCFLHTVLSIQQRCRRIPKFLAQVTEKLWHLYGSLNPHQFGQRLRRLQEWAAKQDVSATVSQKIQGLTQKAARFKLTFEIPQAYRTSNQVDRLMNYQDRILYTMQYFHGTMNAAKQGLRAMALLWNFHPYSRKVQAMEPHSMSPFEDLNGFRYHDNWLRNFLIASSLNGRRTGKPVKHKLE